MDIKIDNVSIGTPRHEYELTESDVAEGAEYAGQTAGTKVTIPYSPAEKVEQPKRGDMLVVEGAGGLSSYVYNHNGGDYDPQYWLACSSGKLDASKIVITEDLTMAGSYDKVGNFVKTSEGQLVPGTSSTGGTQGMTFQELLEKMFSQTNEPVWTKTAPTAVLSVSNPSECEIGTEVSATFTASLSDAIAKYEGGDDQSAGCAVDTNGYKFDGATTGQSSNTVKKSWVAGVDTAPSASVVIDYKEGTNIPKNNLGNASTTIDPQKIPSGSTSSVSKTASVSTYRKVFYTAFTFSNKKSESDIMALTSDDIRKFTGSKSKPTSWSHGSVAQFLIFVPKSDTKKITAAETSKGLPYTFSKLQKDGADYTVSINAANGSSAVDYVVWVDTEGSNVTDPTMKITWG